MVEFNGVVEEIKPIKTKTGKDMFIITVGGISMSAFGRPPETIKIGDQAAGTYTISGDYKNLKTIEPGETIEPEPSEHEKRIEDLTCKINSLIEQQSIINSRLSGILNKLNIEAELKSSNKIPTLEESLDAKKSDN